MRKSKSIKIAIYIACIVAFLIVAFAFLDLDCDGLQGYKEVAVGTNPLSPDTDNDGLSDYQELLIKTNPLLTDTDNDNLSDGEEVALSTNPLLDDSDGDGLKDGYEVHALKSNPLSSDSDGDGLTDSKEVSLGTSPIEADSDHDSLSDYNEVMVYNTNPLSADSDKDDLSDYLEIAVYKTDPLKADTDNDNLTDSLEVKLYNTNPRIPDTDHDGLSDGYEVSLGTNPLMADTDGDDLSDGYEVRLNLNPLANWKENYDTEAFRASLSSFYLNRICEEVISEIEAKCEANNPYEKIWAVLEWIEENIKYDYAKAEAKNFTLQSPIETLTRKKGICGDYAILSAALLIKMGIDKLYMLEIDFYNASEKHAAVAIEINNEVFIVNQRLPPKTLQVYIEYWDYIDGSIMSITFYPVMYVNGDITVEEPFIVYSSIYEEDYFKANISSSQLKAIELKVYDLLKAKNPRLIKDINLKGLAEAKYREYMTGRREVMYLPPGYEKGVVYTFTDYAAYYHPAYITKLLRQLLYGDQDFLVDLQEYNRCYVKVAIAQKRPMDTSSYADLLVVIVVLALR